jgi:hypothetical protein
MKKFNELLEGLDENTQTTIKEAWDAKLSEAREELTSELREEFAQRYEHDKAQITEAVDKFITDKLAEELQDLAEDKKALAQDRVKYHKAISEHAKILDRFVVSQVAKEVKELRDDRANVAEHVVKLDNFVTEQLASELGEFHNDKQALVEQKVKMLREGKIALANTKKAFISKAANLVESTVNKQVGKEIKLFRNDITRARENDFGRKIFEAVANEYGTSYLNESKELNDLHKQILTLKRTVTEAKAVVAKTSEAKALTESKLNVAQDRFTRKEKLDELLAPLGKEKKEIMSDLLESAKTERLQEYFDKYLPSVIKTDSPRKSTLKESAATLTSHDGNREASAKAEQQENSADIVELAEIKKLAGIVSR